MPRLITKECNQRTNERKKAVWQARENAIRLVDKKEYKMEYLQLKKMAEDRIECRQ